MHTALVPGTFDPITTGHVDVITRASRLFDNVIVAVAASTNKRGSARLFSLQERVELAEQSLEHLSNVSVEPFECLLMDFAAKKGASAVVKGLRAGMDFEAEFQMAAVNQHLDPDIETLFVMSSPAHMFVSSSSMKEVASLGGDVSAFVPKPVEIALKQKFA